MLYKLKETATSNIIDIIFDGIDPTNVEEKLEKWLDDNIYDKRLGLNDPASCQVMIYSCLLPPISSLTEMCDFRINIEGERDNDTFELIPMFKEIVSL